MANLPILSQLENYLSVTNQRETVIASNMAILVLPVSSECNFNAWDIHSNDQAGERFTNVLCDRFGSRLAHSACERHKRGFDRSEREHRHGRKRLQPCAGWQCDRIGRRFYGELWGKWCKHMVIVVTRKRLGSFVCERVPGE